MPSVAPPSPQEIHRKLSVHSPPTVSTDAPISSTESDSDSILTPSLMTSSVQGLSSNLHPGSSMPPLSSIAEHRSGSGEDSEEDEEEDGWKSADIRAQRQNLEEGVIKSGYLWKKGERRKTWKKRWFVLRPAHLAYYKNSAEYQLLKLLELSDIHSCTQVTLKRHDNTFGLVSPVRTFYLQAQTPGEVQEWVQAIEDARLALTGTSTQNSASTPIAIPTPTQQSASNLVPPITPSSPTNSARAYNVTSSDSEDASPSRQRVLSVSPQNRLPLSPSKPQGTISKDPSSKVVLSGYLMKCGSKRRNWRKRWFILSEEKLVYSGSHMDTRPHRQFSLSQIVDALEFDLPSNRNPTSLSSSIVSASPSSEADSPQSAHTFKIVTTKRTLLLCAPSEEDEIKWLGSIRALIARRSGVPS
ncbi:Pleckstrin like protein [Termitomyces sp. J132]|nr:Pleckstrin like protein [Termitomyces sp. J132]